MIDENLLYENANGKVRYASPDGKRESDIRRKWFDNVSEEVRKNLDLSEAVTFEIVGSVKNDQAREDSDIDVVVKGLTKNKVPIRIAPLRQAFVEVIEKLKEEDEVTYQVELLEPGNSMMFNHINNLKRLQNRN